jgi:hypothetical protein
LVKLFIGYRLWEKALNLIRGPIFRILGIIKIFMRGCWNYGKKADFFGDYLSDCYPFYQGGDLG